MNIHKNFHKQHFLVVLLIILSPVATVESRLTLTQEQNLTKDFTHLVKNVFES